MKTRLSLLLFLILVVGGMGVGAAAFSFGRGREGDATCPSADRDPFDDQQLAAGDNEIKGPGIVASRPLRVAGADFQVFVEGQARVPAVGDRWPVQLGLRVANVSDRQLVFYNVVRFTLTLPDGTPLRMGGGADGIQNAPPLLVAPGKNLVLSGNASLRWTPKGQTLQLHGMDDTATFWWCQDLMPGRYLLSAVYELAESADPARPVWTGKVRTPPVAFEILDGRVGLRASAPVQVAGVDFEALAEAQPSAPPPGGRQPVALGLGVSNRGEKLLLFNQHDTLRPNLKSADGKAFLLGGGRDVTDPALPVRVAPGKTETVWRRAHLEWLPDGKTLRLSGPDGSGGVWYFDGLVPGKYLLSFDFENSEETLAQFFRFRPTGQERKQSFWVGKVTTAEVEFEIPRPWLS